MQLTWLETETRVIARVTYNNNERTILCAQLLDTGGREFFAQTLFLPVRMNCQLAQTHAIYRAIRCLHNHRAEQYVTDRRFILQCHKRQNIVAVCAKIVEAISRRVWSSRYIAVFTGDDTIGEP